MVANACARRAPLCPAGHLPLEEGDRISFDRGASSSKSSRHLHQRARPRQSRVISPLEGEMPAG
ncbi:lytic murein transglycosylase [Jiella endophytica]|uniref:Lytic murein transglycosylase n=1 Tax=Jiella endophytica TaxID=2558362 RepID=A0A4Y8R7W3_9HYPH|nr:lytic murein transglycosylase [Jiella endophytica]